ncbi:MAG: M23 family metallopeptidase [Microthrixaceae bacterium]
MIDQDRRVVDGQRQLVWGTTRQAIAAGVATAVWAGAYYSGLAYNLLALTLFASPVVVGVSRGWSWRRGRLRGPLWRGPRRWHVAQAVNVLVLCLAIGTVVLPAVVNIQFGRGEYRSVLGWLLIGVASLAVGAIFPKRSVSALLNVLVLVATFWLGAQLLRLHQEPSGAVSLQFPLEGEWYVIQGGPSVLYNHHWAVPEQRYALDLIAVEGDKYRRDGAVGDGSYLAWDQPVRSSADGRVVQAMNTPNGVAGSHVVIDMGDGRYVLLAHLREGSITVDNGERVHTGDLIGRVGSTGNSSEPHLHIQVQNDSTLEDSTRSFPIVFQSVARSRGGHTQDTDRADLRRDDRVRNIN